MQQCQALVPAARPGSVPKATPHVAGAGGLTKESRHRDRHEGLLLIAAPGHALRVRALCDRVALRLMSPAARIEGVDRLLADPDLPRLAAASCGFVLLLPPLGNLDNPLYRVHPRRNDRFVAARPPLRSLFPEIDFADFDFTGHLLGSLAATCPQRFTQMRTMLCDVWIERLHALLDRLPPHGVLLHLPGPAWLPVPLERLRHGRRPVVTVDTADRRGAAEALRQALARTVPVPA